MFLFVLAAIFWLHCSRERFGGGQDVARNPVCGMQVGKQHPGSVLRAGGQVTYFCSEHCRDRYTVTMTPAARKDITMTESDRAPRPLLTSAADAPGTLPGS